MLMDHIQKIATELSIKTSQVNSTIKLLDEGSTIPFISRYRKEATGSLDEVEITNIRDRIIQLRDLDKRREAILKSIEDQDKLTDELKGQIMAAETMSVLEDIYLPYKPKKKTKASVAREKGLEPLAVEIFKLTNQDPNEIARNYVDQEKGVETEEQALQGARDIIAEWINEDASMRDKMRTLFFEKGVFKTRLITGKEQEGQKFRDYFEWEEPVKTAPSHRVLAMRRGEKELFIMLDSGPPESDAIDLLESFYLKKNNSAAGQVRIAIKDSYKRLLKPSMENELRLETKKKADQEAINVFAENLRQLLMSAPLGEKAVLAVDPGFRTGCKLVCLNKQGKLLQNETIFPNEPQKQISQASAVVMALCQKHNIEAIAIGNGTASRETEAFIKQIGLPKHILVVMVNESGASVYSASEIARNEFPDHDVTVRGSVSIGRRLMDPLAELVKIDPKSIGVGQYQHDVDQGALKKSLDEVVMSCVNKVGVELNTASKELLTYVSGLGPQLAGNIVQYRDEKGPFSSREELKKVTRLGDKAFEQAAGFLRIGNGRNILDASGVHPESYYIVKKMAKDQQCTIEDLIRDQEKRTKIRPEAYVDEKTGLPTLQDILAELDKPGRDPREKFEVFSFEEGIHHMEDLKSGMKLPGIITNITKFGAFVDVGVHQDGLVHISHIADKFVKDPAEVVKVHQKVMVTVLEVDINRKRISLSLKSDPFEEKKGKKKMEKKEPEDFNSKLAQLKNRFGN